MNPRTAAVLALAFGPFLVGSAAHAQDSSIFVQCPSSTDVHPTPGFNPGEIKCAHITGGDGMVTMADDAQTKLYMFGFAPVDQGSMMSGIASPVGASPDAPPAPAINSAEFPGWVMDSNMLAANSPAPTIAVDEDDELFLTLTNVGMALRPDLADPHSVHWHGFPQASAIFDGVPDASVSINMGASLTYYYNAKDAGTYMYHCHVEATEHMQMGMNGNLFVRPRQNRLAGGTVLGAHVHQPGDTYAYNDNDGSTIYDVEVPIQMGSWDPVFHNASYGVQPLPFVAMHDTYFFLNGRGYPDTVNPAVLQTEDDLGRLQNSQPVSSLIEASPGERVLIRISNLNVTDFYSLGTNGLPMKVIALDARLLQDELGNKLYYDTHSVTLGGGMSADAIIEIPATAAVGETYFLYSTNLTTLANDAENFGGMMTEIRIVP